MQGKESGQGAKRRLGIGVSLVAKILRALAVELEAASRGHDA